MRALISAFCFCALAVPAHADLRYRLRIEVRTAAAEISSAVPPVETVMLVRGDAIRLEQVGSGTKLVLLFRPDGQFVLDTDARTYSQIPDLPIRAPGAAAPSATFRRTGDFTTILGLRAERVELSMSLSLPMTPPPGVPTVLPVVGELWVADAYRDYAANIIRAAARAGVAVPEIEGIVLRQVVRNAQLGIEIEQRVTEIVETAASPRMFEIPEGFRRLTDPAGRR
jgi:hypothetical protein